MRFKTKEEFIQAVMAGRKFEFMNEEFYYDSKEENPFRLGDDGLRMAWKCVTTEEFTEIIEPRTEKRWIMLKDDENTTKSTNYFNQKYIDDNFKADFGWYKGESITVTLKDNR